MKKSWLAVTIALALSLHAQVVFAQAAVGTGGAGGAGGAATGGTAAGGAATNSNNLTTSGGSGGQGGTGGTGGLSSAAGGTASATGVQTGAISSTGNNQAAEVTVNYITPVSPGGLKGLAAGVDPESGHFVNDNNVRYSGTQKIKNTPDASIGGPASGPCNGFSGGIGVSVPGFAIGANTSTVDPGCTARETARIAAMLGRMDIANAVLENTSVVQEALKARAVRIAAEASPAAVPTAAAPVQAAPLPVRSTAERAVEEALLKEQQRFAVEALQRKATMDKVYDTLTFTDAVSQGSERTPQQVMAQEATQKLAERTKRQEDQLKLERRLAALKSEPPEQRQNSLAPLVSNVKLALAAPRAADAAAARASEATAPQPAAPQAAAVAPPAAAPVKVPQPALDPAQAAKLLRSVEPAANVTPTPSTDKVKPESAEPATAASSPAAPAPAQPRKRDDAVAPPAHEQSPLASQPMLRNVRADEVAEIFGFKGAKPAIDDVSPDAPARKSTNKATKPAAKPDGGQQATNRDAPAENPAGDMKKVPMQPADALNFAKANSSVQ